MMRGEKNMPKPVESPPSAEQIVSEYARRICEEMARKYGQAYLLPEVIYGFATFLQLSIDIHLKYHAGSSTCETEDKVAKNPD